MAKRKDDPREARIDEEKSVQKVERELGRELTEDEAEQVRRQVRKDNRHATIDEDDRA